jgi:hypothetical protein
MLTTENFLDWPVYGLEAVQKQSLLSRRLHELTQWHRSRCPQYGALLSAYGDVGRDVPRVCDVPFFPVRLFKTERLQSVEDQQIVSTLTSSGTASQTASQIFLDRQTANHQTRALVKILQTFIGTERLPMLIIDHPEVIKNRTSFSARGAGILGLSNFGRDHVYALADGSMEYDLPAVEQFLQRHRGKPLLLFGFTFMVWKYWVQYLERNQLRHDISEGILIHSGGWKKMLEEAVDNSTFKRRLCQATGISRIHNFYGMVEQVGSVHVECEEGYLHTPSFGDILIRDPRDWSVMGVGEEGVIQVLSVLPTSYPGHSLLTEDLGVLQGEDDCRCGRLGKYFSVMGRVPQAELRGCGDTHAAQI